MAPLAVELQAPQQDLSRRRNRARRAGDSFPAIL